MLALPGSTSGDGRLISAASTPVASEPQVWGGQLRLQSNACTLTSVKPATAFGHAVEAEPYSMPRRNTPNVATETPSVLPIGWLTQFFDALASYQFTRAGACLKEQVDRRITVCQLSAAGATS